MVYHYIFDLFGTLVTDDGYQPMMESLFPEVKYDSLKSFLNVTRFPSVEDCVQGIGSTFGISINDEREDKIIRTNQEWVESRKLFPYAKEVLAELRVRRSKIGLLSNNNTFVESVVDNVTLNDYFETMVLSHSVGLEKPQDAIYRLCRDLMGKGEVMIPNSSIIMVGDQVDKDVLKPQELGMNGVLFDPKNKSNYQPRITSLLELLDYLPS